MSDTEFLDVGDHRQPRTSWRLRLVLLAVVLVVGVVALAVDREVRQREEQAVAGCATRVGAAVDMAGRRVRATYEYVRPSLMNPTPELQAAVRRIIEKSADGAGTSLTAPRESCADVTVFPLHDELQARRDRCLAILDAHRAGLAAVAADGGELGEWLAVPLSC